MKVILPLFICILICSCATTKHRYSQSSAEDLYYNLITDSQRLGFSDELNKLKKLGPPPKMTPRKFIESEDEALTAYSIKLNAINFSGRAKAAELRKKNPQRFASMPARPIIMAPPFLYNNPAPISYNVPAYHSAPVPTPTPVYTLPRYRNPLQGVNDLPGERQRRVWQERDQRRKINGIATKLGVY